MPSSGSGAGGPARRRDAVSGHHRRRELGEEVRDDGREDGHRSG